MDMYENTFPLGLTVFITYRIRLKEVMEGVDPHTARLVILHQAEGGCRDTTIDPS